MNYIVDFIVIFCNNLEACKVTSLLYEVLYHTIENTANQNTGKPLYIRRYSTQPSHRALRCYSRRNLVSVFSMAWYKIVTQHFLVVYYGISHLSLSLAATGVTADLDPPRGFGRPGPNPLADMDPPDQIR